MYFNSTKPVTVANVASVVVSVNNLGKASPALVSMELLLQGNSALAVFTGGAAPFEPRCPAINEYPVAGSASAALRASVASRANEVVVGVRLRPSQANVSDNTHLINVRGACDPTQTPMNSLLCPACLHSLTACNTLLACDLVCMPLHYVCAAKCACVMA